MVTSSRRKLKGFPLSVLGQSVEGNGLTISLMRRGVCLVFRHGKIRERCPFTHLLMAASLSWICMFDDIDMMAVRGNDEMKSKVQKEQQEKRSSVKTKSQTRGQEIRRTNYECDCG